MSAQPHCRFCATPLRHTFVDLGLQPLANSYLTAAQLAAGEERSYPLHARVCHACFLVQVDDVVPAEAIFDQDYAYFSSYSTSWVAHAKAYPDCPSDAFATAASLTGSVGGRVRHRLVPRRGREWRRHR